MTVASVGALVGAASASVVIVVSAASRAAVAALLLGLRRGMWFTPRQQPSSTSLLMHPRVCQALAASPTGKERDAKIANKQRGLRTMDVGPWLTENTHCQNMS